MTNPFNKRFPAGYVLQVDSWENDGDHSLLEMSYGLTLDQVKFYIAFLNSLEGLENNDYEPYSVFAVLAKLHPLHRQVIDNLFVEYHFERLIISYNNGNLELEKLKYGSIIDRMYDLITSLLGDPVEYEGRFVRVYDGHKVFLLKEEVVIPALKEVNIK